MDALTFAARYVITTAIGERPVRFADRQGQPATEEQFIRHCWAEGVDPYAVVRLCERRVATAAK